MADHISVPVVGGAGIRRADAAWAPLSEPVFRSLWIAAVISYTGSWMQNVGAGWLMTQLTTSPLMVSLVQAAAAVPVFLVVLPAGGWRTWSTGGGFFYLRKGGWWWHRRL